MTMLNEAYKAFSTIPKEFKDRGSDCLYQLQEAATAFDAFAEQVKQELEQKREDAHDKAIRACRSQLKAIEELDATIVRTEERFREAESSFSGARLALSSATNTALPRYAVKEEIAARDRAIEQAQQLLAKAEDKFTTVNGSLTTLRMRRRDLQQHLALLEGEEYDLRPETEKSAVHPNPFGLGGPAKSLPAA
jgi:chromosome segregation ATPase